MKKLFLIFILTFAILDNTIANAALSSAVASSAAAARRREMKNNHDKLYHNGSISFYDEKHYSINLKHKEYEDYTIRYSYYTNDPKKCILKREIIPNGIRHMTEQEYKMELKIFKLSIGIIIFIILCSIISFIWLRKEN